LVIKPLTTWACALFAPVLSNLLLNPPCTLVDIAAIRAKLISTAKTTRATGLDMVTTPCQSVLSDGTGLSGPGLKDESPGCDVRINHDLKTPLEITT
jgi:hypothetical protein